MFTSIGLLFVFWSTKYNIGSAKNMGPGYFPLALGALLSVIGVINVVRSVLTTENLKNSTVAVRPVVFILLASIAFGVLINGVPSVGIPSFGIVLSVIALTVISRLATKPFHLVETALLAIALSLLTYIVFVVLLEMPLPLLPKIF